MTEELTTVPLLALRQQVGPHRHTKATDHAERCEAHPRRAERLVSHLAEQRERGTADPLLLMAWGSTVWTAPHSGVQGHWFLPGGGRETWLWHTFRDRWLARVVMPG